MASNDSLAKTIQVVVGVSLVCSIVVSLAAVGLRGMQQQNAVEDKQKNILAVSGIELAGRKVADVYAEAIEPRVIDLATGEFVAEDQVNPQTFEQRKSAKDPETSIRLSGDEDIAGIVRRSNLASVYLVKNDQGDISRVILPVHGRGLWSTMYAFLAIQPDGNTVDAIVYYDQGETPGLGGEVANPLWQAKFVGKKLFDDNGDTAISVIKGIAPADSPSEVDGLSGATLTSNGVDNTFKFWLSDKGFGKFLAKLQQGDLNNG
ncbi:MULTISPECIES: Na(+)-translocating NADH-quinone reductase subunit C [unclassified Agarivorans]|uniref:Na(+)-translocating NADH-quinone reductase subunit C n=1 Tax=unclassified Agarivorans TaxID=2636026 RepID=UPI0010D07E4E|nr:MULTISPECIES: Na(+)-translocating NADH-quinone reductase subunit C [unclassified Agarivorans]MDO6684051.1 Na(+)-translocating NADH-quinone reductase subunit C [Agarivorans sp. 3_MG-2023]MDO6714215.1 Na(+)-translocating NADH-quinone reductase subunit C [Agarivorans sp. 2_MG-2023]MDO6762547.1 Na(+)-translocating NADH-quinone reductase subunit C [Agarivorans sp. 1_MG-2023]GDY24918.1 Na(+)-translocating NADH-quinone reductase subunit C [Agarivorans sp. Toyoura001]